MLLVCAHVGELLLLHDLHHRLLEGLADEHLEDGLDLHVEVEQVALVDLRLDVDARLHRDEDRRGQLVHEGVGLRVNVHLDRPVGELLEVLLGLHVDVLAPLGRLRRVRLRRQRRPPLRRLHLRLALHLKLLGLRGGREDLRGVGVAAHDALVVHDVVRLRDGTARRGDGKRSRRKGDGVSAQVQCRACVCVYGSSAYCGAWQAGSTCSPTPRAAVRWFVACGGVCQARAPGAALGGRSGRVREARTCPLAHGTSSASPRQSAAGWHGYGASARRAGETAV